MLQKDQINRHTAMGVAVMAIHIELWPVSRLVFYARNPRRNDAAVDFMVASIPEFGFKIPVLARSSGEIVDGHLRTKAAIKMGMPEVPVILCDDWMDLLRTVFIEDVGNAPLPVQQISIGDESLSRQEQGRDGLLIGIPAREIVRRLQWIRTDLDEFLI